MNEFKVQVVVPASVSLDDIRVYPNGLQGEGISIEQFIKLAFSWRADAFKAITKVDLTDWVEIWGVLRTIQIMTAPDSDTPFTIADIRALVLKGMGVAPEENPK